MSTGKKSKSSSPLTEIIVGISYTTDASTRVKILGKIGDHYKGSNGEFYSKSGHVVAWNMEKSCMFDEHVYNINWELGGSYFTGGCV